MTGRHGAGTTTGYLPTVAKGIAAGVTTAAGALAVAYADGALTTAELWTVVGAALAAAGVVWRVPNADRPS